MNLGECCSKGMSQNVGPDSAPTFLRSPHVDVSRLDVSWIGHNLLDFQQAIGNFGVDTEVALDDETTEEVLENANDLD